MAVCSSQDLFAVPVGEPRASHAVKCHRPLRPRLGLPPRVIGEVRGELSGAGVGPGADGFRAGAIVLGGGDRARIFESDGLDHVIEPEDWAD